MLSRDPPSLGFEAQTSCISEPIPKPTELPVPPQESSTVECSCIISTNPCSSLLLLIVTPVYLSLIISRLLFRGGV